MFCCRHCTIMSRVEVEWIVLNGRRRLGQYSVRIWSTSVTSSEAIQQEEVSPANNIGENINVEQCSSGPNQSTGFAYTDRFHSKCTSFPDLVSSLSGINTFQIFCITVKRLHFKLMCCFTKTISDSCADEYHTNWFMHFKIPLFCFSLHYLISKKVLHIPSILVSEFFTSSAM